MDRARRLVAAHRRLPVVADAFSRAEGVVERAEGQLEAGDYTAAMVSFGQAEAAFVDIGRRAERHAEEEVLRNRLASARQNMEERRTGVSAWRNEPANATAFEEGEEFRREGIRHSDAGRHNDAITAFQRAEAAFGRVKEPVAPAETENPSLADAARVAMQRARTGVPAELRSHAQYGEAAQLEERARDAYEDRRFEASADLYRQADRLYTAVAALPLPKTAEQEVQESLEPILARFRSGLQEEDGEALNGLHRFLGAYSAMFDVADDIRADTDYSNVSVSGNRATVSVTVNMSYKNKTQRNRAEQQTVRLLWTLEQTNAGEWLLREITRQ
jgi:hypothetical protein